MINGLRVWNMSLLFLLAAFVTQTASALTEQQVARGSALWANTQRFSCSECHYLDSENDVRRRALVGKDALPPERPREGTVADTLIFNTAGDLIDFLETRCRQRPSLSQQEATDLAALILSKNGVHADGTELTRTNAEQLSLDRLLPQRHRLAYCRYVSVTAGLLLVLAAIWFARSWRAPT